MGALLGLAFGLGVLCMVRAASAPRAPSRRLATWRRRHAERLHQAGIDGVGPVGFVAVQLGVAFACGVGVFAITGIATIAACFGVLAVGLPPRIVARLVRRRRARLRQVWPEVISDLASAVRAGMSLPEGLAALAVRGPADLRAAFARFGAAYRASGRFSSCLDRLKADLADPVGDRVCETVRVAREVGGADLGLVLRTLADVLRADARARAELETRQGWVVNGARLAVAAPWLVLLLLATQTSTVRAYDSPAGALVLAVGAGLCIAAYAIMLRLGRLPDEPRVLR